MKALVRIFISWLPLGIAVTGLCLLVYVAAQQGFRQGFNDVSIEVAEGAALKLDHGVSPKDIASGDTVDIKTSISPFIIIYDEQGRVVAGNGVLDEQIPTPPHGVFQNVSFWRTGHSWQPEKDVRIDAVIIPYTISDSSGFVLAGRNMRVMEDHIVHVGWLVLQAWFLLMVTTFLAKGVARYVE